MTDKLTHEIAETVVHDKPLEVISKLPDNIESREARRLIDVVTDLVHHSLEKAPRPPAD
jgi:hypothetical protein